MLHTNFNCCTTISTIATSNSELKPSAYIAVNKNRVKHYTLCQDSSNVHLTGDTEFQIELFNPSQSSYLAKIEINGELISQSGIVLYPGQRIFLERYINESKKFKFKTYEVSGSSEVVKKAIEKNGLVKVYFYEEKKIYSNIFTLPNGEIRSNYCDNSISNIGVQGSKGPQGAQGVLGTVASNAVTFCTNNIPCTYTSNSTIETGRVEKGSQSNQNFDIVYDQFNYLSSKTQTIHLLPLSMKQYEVGEINKFRKYCSNCGKKVGQNDKYCSSCGNKL